MGIYEDFFIKMCVAGVSCNIVLMALNLIPIPPLWTEAALLPVVCLRGMALAVLKNRAVRNVDFVCADSDGNFCPSLCIRS